MPAALRTISHGTARARRGDRREEKVPHPGAIVELCLNSGRKAIRFQAVIRNASAQEASFEIVDIEFEERTKLRKLLLQSGKALQQDGSAPLRQMEQQTAEIAS